MLTVLTSRATDFGSGKLLSLEWEFMVLVSRVWESTAWGSRGSRANDVVSGMPLTVLGVYGLGV